MWECVEKGEVRIIQNSGAVGRKDACPFPQVMCRQRGVEKSQMAIPGEEMRGFVFR